MQKLADKKTIVLVLIIIMVSGLFVYKNIWPKYKDALQKTSNHDVGKSDSRPKKTAPKENVASSRKEYEPNHCILRKKVSNEEEIIFDNKNCNLSISKWSDYLFFPEGNGYQEEDVVLYAYNIKTGEKIKVYSIDEYAHDYTDRPYDIYLGDIFDDALFFTAGGYMTDQVIYSLDLSNIKSKPKLISSDAQYAKISYLDGYHWIEGGVGDAGFSATKRALFDIKAQKIIGQEIKTSSNMGVGEDYLGADEDRALMASLIGIPDPQSEYNEYEAVLSEIYSLDLMKKKDPKIIVGKKSVPPNIRRVVYMHDNKNLVLLGDDAYIYNLKEEELKKIASLKDIELSWSNNVSRDAFCINEKLKLDTKKKAIVTDENDCAYKNTTLDEKLSEKIKSFNLPSEYSFEFSKGQ